MTALITNRTSMSRSEAEPIAEKIVSARDKVLNKVYEMEIKVNEKMAEAKDKALIAAEESRKAAATAAWWLVGTAVVSAAASAFGGMLALEGILF
jgi:divalent metal cation (Fe/Co/Zn/Cd) transporter